MPLNLPVLWSWSLHLTSPSWKRLLHMWQLVWHLAFDMSCAFITIYSLCFILFIHVYASLFNSLSMFSTQSIDISCYNLFLGRVIGANELKTARILDVIVDVFVYDQFLLKWTPYLHRQYTDVPTCSKNL